MGASVNDQNFFQSEKYVDLYHENFYCSYLSGLKNYKAIGKFDDSGNAIAFLSFYQSSDEPSWYGTQIRSKGDRRAVRDLLDYAIEINEQDNRYKFYTLWSAEQTKSLRRFAFSERTNERYDYFDEYLVPAKHKCLYTTHWHVLFNRILLPLDTVVRCTFLKQKYRTNIAIGGNI
jgi:hypothetical protein